MKSNESTENYLEAILILSKEHPVVRSVDIADYLDFKKSSVSVAMKKLRENNDIEVSDEGYITLTESGFATARMIYERHVLISNWLISIGVDEKIAREALSRVGGDFILENRSLDSKVEVGGNNFSTGEKQLICLARALAKDPKILILDESTANIDSETEQNVSRAIEELKQGRTTLIIAHRLSTIKNADMIYVLRKGKVIESGTHEQLLALEGSYKKMYETQVKG